MHTDEEFTEAIGRVAFSYESMSYSARWLIDHEGREVRVGLWDAHVDSFLVHARRLFAFLEPTSTHHADDVLISDFLEPVPDLILTHTSAEIGNINKRIAHLTYSMEPDRVNWPVPNVSSELHRAMAAFMEQMAMHRPNLVVRLQEAANKLEPTFRKLVN